MVDWQGRKPCSKRFECVATGRNNAAVSGEEYKGLSTEECSACQEYKPDFPQLKAKTKFF
jgi:hypothetical protein